MKVWIYCVQQKETRQQMEIKRKSLITYAKKRNMQILGITNATNEQKVNAGKEIKIMRALRADAVLIYDYADLSVFDRDALLDSCFKNKIPIICCKYEKDKGKQAIPVDKAVRRLKQ